MFEDFWAIICNPQQAIAVCVTIAVFILLQTRRNAPVDLLFLSGLLVLTLCGVLTPQDAFSGFANSAVLTIGALLAVTTALRTCGVLDWIGTRLLGTAKTERAGLLRLALALIPSSAFVLNTALVAMMAPVVVDWCRKRDISPSRMLIPVSYLTILGGVCTLIGTSTTLVVNAQLATEYKKLKSIQWQATEVERGSETSASLANSTDGSSTANSSAISSANPAIRKLASLPADERDALIEGVKPMGLFDIGMIGLPAALVGGTVLLLLGPRLLPHRIDLVEQLGDQRREYLVEMLVKEDCRLIGKSVEAAGLRHLPGLFLIEIDRNGTVIAPVAPEDTINSGDRLIFTGVVKTIVDLEKIPGLIPAADLTYELQSGKSAQRHLTEVVLSRTSPLIRRTIKEANFRQQYGAAVVAVHRNGVRLSTKIGDIVLQAGDTLLLQTQSEFVSLYRNSRDFYLVSAVEGSEPRKHDKLSLASAIVLIMLGWMIVGSFSPDPTIGWRSPAVIAFVAVAFLVATRCMRMSEARQAIDLQMLLTIAAALGIGMGLSKSGAAASIAHAITNLVSSLGGQEYAMLITIYVLTMVMTEMISNTAVAAIMLPIAINIAAINGHNPRTFIVAVSLSASLAFVTPIGYQTNLMVMGPGSYRPIDYVRVGLPVSLSVATAILILLPILWPL